MNLTNFQIGHKASKKRRYISFNWRQMWTANCLFGCLPKLKLLYYQEWILPVHLVFKGIVWRDGFGFWGHVWLVLGLNREPGHWKKFFRCSNDFIMQKIYFSQLTLSLHLLNNVRGVYLVQVFLLFIGQQSLRHFFRHRPLLPVG
jgi:hypothetical protein